MKNRQYEQATAAITILVGILLIVLAYSWRQPFLYVLSGWSFRSALD